jgi:hypothetical protein
MCFFKKLPVFVLVCSLCSGAYASRQSQDAGQVSNPVGVQALGPDSVGVQALFADLTRRVSDANKLNKSNIDGIVARLDILSQQVAENCGAISAVLESERSIFAQINDLRGRVDELDGQVDILQAILIGCGVLAAIVLVPLFFWPKK